MAKRKKKKKSGFQKLQIGMALLMAVITIAGIAMQIVSALGA